MREYRNRVDRRAARGTHGHSMNTPLAVLLVGVLSALQLVAQPPVDCRDQPSFMHVSRARLLKHALHRVQPLDTLIDASVVDAIVTVKVLVDSDGKVVCAAVVGPANPLLASVSLKAARQWTFKPLTASQNRASMRGEIVFHIKR
jgi:Gram-negative bacterial TonB protein C-terminal